jgi:hypothetical protein
MSIPEDKTEMMDDATLAMIDGVRSAIREVDPTALVSMGYFAPQEPNPLRVGDTRISRTRAAIWESSADYIDLHAYPGGDAALAQIVDNYGMQGMQTKPIIMGEFGAFDNLFPSVDSAASALVAWQVESCQYGFDGWLLWTWDDNTQGEILPATAGEGQIGRSLAPATRPDACAYGGMVEKNLALDAYTRASSALPNEPSELAVDGLGGTQWGAGADAPQWFEIDLGTPAKIHEIRLQVAQYPEGETKHTVLVRNASGSFQAAAVFDQFTRSEEWLVFRPENPLEGVQVVRVETAYSPSWVAWKEIQVFGEPH